MSDHSHAPVRRLSLTAAGAAALMAVSGCGLAGDDENTISIIVTESAPFQEPTEIAAELLAEEGYELDIRYVTDINIPNQSVQDGEYDANYFQHLAYLENFNRSNDTDIAPAFSVYYAPAGIFSLEHDSLEDLPDGAQLNLPVDPSNNGRALQLLADEGLIEIDEDVPVIELTQGDITSNPKNLDFVETDQQEGARALSDVDAGFAFVRLVAEAGHDVEDAELAIEDGRDEVRTPFTCVVAVNPDDVTSEEAELLQEAFQSEEVEQWFEDYQGGVVDYDGSITIDNAEETWEEFQG